MHCIRPLFRYASQRQVSLVVRSLNSFTTCATHGSELQAKQYLLRMRISIKKPVLVQCRIDTGFCSNNLRTVERGPTLSAGRKILVAAVS
jgi:hypothetical protein